MKTDLGTILIKNGKLIDPAQGISQMLDLLVSDGNIASLTACCTVPEKDVDIVIDAAGQVVCPGFIDLHCHLRDPGFPEKETIPSGAAAAAKGGFTTICCMPNTKPPIDNRETIDYVKSKATGAPVLVLPIGCVTEGRAGNKLANMKELASCGVIGFSDDGDAVMNAQLLRQALEYSKTIGLPIIEHCEDANLVKDGQMNEGELSHKLNLKGRPGIAEEIIVARDLLLAEESGGWIHIAHVSSAAALKLIEQAKLRGVHVTCEVTPHHLTLTENEVGNYCTSAKVNPPLRTTKDTAALAEGLAQGIIDIIATDHAPHSTADKEQEFALAPSGISVFETALASLLSLVHDGKISLDRLVTALTCAPASILGKKWDKLGTLQVGSIADITIFDPNREWLVDTRQFISKGKNTPLNGRKLQGKVTATISHGRLVYQDDSLTRLKTKEVTNG